MKSISTLVWFRKWFPVASSLFLAVAVLWWGIAAVLGVAEGSGSRRVKAGAGLPSWQDITPTCEVVLRELGKAHAGVRDALVRCHGAELSLKEFSEHLKATKRGLRKLNIGGLEELDVKENALELRQSQIAIYTVMRQRGAKFADADAAAAAGKGMEPIGKLLEQWRGECNAFSERMADFAYNANVLQDEIEDGRAAAAIFGPLGDFDGATNEPVRAVRQN